MHIEPNREIAQRLPMPRENEQPSKRYIQEPIAIVGMGCRLPGHSNSPNALWELLEKGGIADNTPPTTRFSLGTHYDSSKKPHTMRSPGGMFLEDVDPRKFDAAFFGIGKIDAIAMDPQQRQLLEVVYECLENAGITLERLNGEKIGCFIGSYAVDYADMQARDPDDRAPSVTIGVGRAILSNRISHFLNIHGPSMTIDTACSGGLVALDIACRYLSDGEIDGAIVGSANLYLSPEHNMDVGPMNAASSPSGRCHTFDKKADGYIKAEGINCVMLKRLSDAQKDGDPVRAVIRGTATNSDGRTPGIASPSSTAQAAATRAAYARAGVTDFSATAYIEMHGTGTQAGDPEEVRGVAAVFAPSRPESCPLIIGSIKSNVGHSEPAAGISGLLKAVLAVEKAQIPGNPTFINPNPSIDFEGSRVRATRWTIPWLDQKRPRRASVNSFGYGGSNAHCLIEEFPTEKRSFASCFNENLDEDLFADDTSEVSRPYILVLSANDENATRAYARSLHKHLINPRVSVPMESLAFTLCERRTRHFHRGYLVTNNRFINPDAFAYGKKTETPRIGFIFTGQGSQWPQMGRSLLQNFPVALDTIRRLDNTLQNLAQAPTWNLVAELTEPRDPETFREPEFSQPLVTALQIAIVNVLASWGVHARAVVGHSSGEIAAAYAAGLLSEENAMKAAFYRGFAVKVSSESQWSKMGMMAVGLDQHTARDYLRRVSLSHPDVKVVTIACYNSPNSVTLSGPLSVLEAVKDVVVADKHFARVLEVDLAYHSPFMEDIGETYARHLEKESFFSNDGNSEIIMFSSVNGHIARGPLDANYWKSNMVQPVLFSQALSQMLTDEDYSNFLIEIGPGGALAGPVAQIQKNIAVARTDAQYCSAMMRGQGAITAIFHVAGKLFLAGYDVNLAAVNAISTRSAAKVLVDLPNYSWNHDKDYWYESEASYEWRNRAFAHHDLLGSKVLGTPWQAPVWKKSLNVEDVPWLKDHRLGPEIVFPGAGYICMAIEAMLQTDKALRMQDRRSTPLKRQVRLRNVTFDKALILKEGQETRVMVTLAPWMANKDSWYLWTVQSLQESWIGHCSGQVRLETDINIRGATAELTSLLHPVPGTVWYKAMSDVGYKFGKSFQKLLLAETVSGSRQCRSHIDLVPPTSKYLQSEYPLHPVALDGCMQSCAPGLWRGMRSSVDAVLVPATIDDIIVRTTDRMPAKGVSDSISVMGVPGRFEEAKNYASSAKVYDFETGELIFKLTGLRYHKLDFQDSPYAAHKYSRLLWAPDITLGPQVCGNDGQSDSANIQQILDLVAHKSPNARVLELLLLPHEATSFWLEGLSSQSKPRNAYGSYKLMTDDATALVETQTKYATLPRTSFDYIASGNILGLDQGKPSQQVDLVIVRIRSRTQNSLPAIIDQVCKLLSDNALVLLFEKTDVPDNKPNGAIEHHQGETPCCNIEEILCRNNLNAANTFNFSKSDGLPRGILAVRSRENPVTTSLLLDIVHLATPGEVCRSVSEKLKALGWDVREIQITKSLHNNIRDDAIILIISELEASQLPTLTSEQWVVLKDSFQRQNTVVWASRAAQMEVRNPDGAIIYGLCRSIRTENPSAKIIMVDLDDPAHHLAADHINTILNACLDITLESRTFDTEYVERGGVFYVSRILGDDAFQTIEAARITGTRPIDLRLHAAATTIRMVAERVGSIDSLQFVEVDSSELSLPENTVEVELSASALNFKDVAVTMGIVPENHHLLGLEGAGTIRRAGKNLKSPFHVGERVLVFEKGTFANRIIATTERTIRIPHWLSFEEAATLPSVYLTALYSLFELASVKKGDRVLIHSASGGLGIASIQICQSVGADIYATVGQDAKKKFLWDEFQIPGDHVFSSRDQEFEVGIMRHTNGYGVDIILNSLTGDLLDASWRCIAEGGTMVELGKKDHIERNVLSMEPFARNASYRCFDMSHKHVSDHVIAVLMRRMMDLVSSGVVKPISPVRIFPYSDIPAAVRLMRSANHIGKIIISNKIHIEPDPVISVRPATPVFTLREDVSFLLIGGLKGLCGSLAVDMARHGARHIVVMSRSSYDDQRSKGALRDLEAHGCHVDLICGNVSNVKDVRRAFESASRPVSGVIQGAMVLRDKPFEVMSHDDYLTAIDCKVAGTWNLHNVAIEKGLVLDFFCMLSSISGLIGQPAQANYAAANVFLDSFAYYRRGLGLKANSVNLGAIDDVGYMAEHSELIDGLDRFAWTPINEPLFHQIMQYSILQQRDVPICNESAAQLITSIAVPQVPSSRLLTDARFSSLLFGEGAGAATMIESDASAATKEIQQLQIMIKNGIDVAASLPGAVDIVNRQLMVTLRLEETIEPGKSPSVYGLDSLAAVEFRNWCKAQLGVQLTTLQITGAPSLQCLAESIVNKMQEANRCNNQANG